MAGRNMRFEYDVGEIVLCFEPDPTKARVLYDAKVVEQRTIKDITGKKKAVYVVHFQGWNSSWDRQVGEHYLLRNTDENRELMRKLTDTARKFCKKNSQRRRKINTILHEAFGGAPPEFDVITDSEESDDESDSGKKTGRGKVGQEKKRQKTSLVEYDIPETLKMQLEEDYILINKKNKLTRVPAKPCVIDILESFMKTFCVNYVCDPTGGREKTRNSSSKHTLRCPPDKCVSLCKEFVDSLRVIFDFTLPIILLYAAEQQQFESAMKDIKPVDLIARDKEASLLPSDESPNRAVRSGAQNAKLKSERMTKHSQSQHHRSTSPTLSCSSKSSTSFMKESPTTPARRSPTTPARRITRQSAHEMAASDSQNMKQKPHITVNQQPHRSSRHSDLSSPKSSRRLHKEDASIIPIASRTRRRSQLEVIEVSDAPIVKLEPSSDMEMDVPSPDLPGPSQSDQGLVNGQEGPSSAAGTEIMTLGSSRGREDAMDRILGWQLLPAEVKVHGPVTPSQIYGTVHLLRMFVKLPDLLKKMQMKEVQLQIIIKFIHHCL
ncbi:unnamed protein product, partial [Candidula unifasciata]